MFYLDFSDLIPQVRILWVSYPHLDRYQIHIEPIQRYIYIYILYYIILNHIIPTLASSDILWFIPSFPKKKHPRRSPPGERLVQAAIDSANSSFMALLSRRANWSSLMSLFPWRFEWRSSNLVISRRWIDEWRCPICEPCMVYKNLENWVILDKGKCWDSYSSTMVRIWDS